MFSFLKSKPVLADLIPSDHIDFHSHLMHGIDDGAKTPEGTVYLVKKLMSAGCTSFITTPHVMYSVWENTRDSILARQSETVDILKNAGIDVPFHAAAEYMMDSYFAQRFQSEELLTLKDKHVLVEMSYVNPPIHLYEMLFDLQVAGYTPVLAHPERYAFYHRNFSEYKKLKNAGCLFQVNLLSTVGYYGESVAKTAEKLLSSGLIDFAGSDVHHKNHTDSLLKKTIIKDTKPLQEALSNNSFFRR